MGRCSFFSSLFALSFWCFLLFLFPSPSCVHVCLSLFSTFLFTTNTHSHDSVLVNSLIDGNTDGVVMMLDWAKAYDSVDHEYLEKVLFYMGCSGIGLQRLMSTAKGFTLRVIGSQ